MSNFLRNLARRGAGLPVTPIQASMPSPFGDFREGSMRADQEMLAEAPQLTDTQPAAAEPSLSTPGIQRSSATETGSPGQPSVQDSVTAFKAPPSAPQPNLFPFTGETQPVSVDPPVGESPPISHSRSDSEAMGETLEARGGHGTAPAGQNIEPAMPVISAPPALLTGLTAPPAEVVAKRAQLGSQGLKAGPQETREPEPPAPAIRPAAAESPMPLHFPKAPITSTPPAQLPVLVRIGRVEVRGTEPQRQAPASPSENTSLGFASYYRKRNYRS